MKRSNVVLAMSAGVACAAASAPASWVLHTGPGSGAIQPVRTFQPTGSSPIGSVFPYGPSYAGGVRVAAGDLTGDGVAELVTGTETNPAGGAGPHVKVFDGVTRAEVRSFFPYDGFIGGVSVAAGDLNGDGRADIITGAGANGHVKAFDGLNHNEIRNFLAFGTSFTGGVNVASGDVNGDGRADLITAVGSGGGPNVRVFSGVDNSPLQNFFATTPSFTGGLYVAAGDVNNDGNDDIIAGLDGAGLVNIFSGRDLSPLGSLNPYGTGFTGGVRVATGDVNGDGFDDIITGAGGSPGGHVKVFDGATREEIGNFFAYDTAFTGGVHVAAGQIPEPSIAGVVLCGLLVPRRRR